MTPWTRPQTSSVKTALQSPDTGHIRRPWRRIGAYLIDYGVIVIWMAGLFGLAGAGVIQMSAGDEMTISMRWGLQAQAFLLLTLPVYLYFTLFEMFGAKATLGKRILGLSVTGSPVQVALRNFLKFAPWEIAHTGIWHGMTVPFQTAPNRLGWVLFIVSISLSLSYLASLFVGSGRPLYDHLVTTQVTLSTR